MTLARIHQGLAVAIVALISACATQSPAPGRQAQVPPGRERGVVVLDGESQHRAGVVIDTVRQLTHTEQISAPGVLALDEERTARIGSLQEGLVLETQALVGDRVRAGQLLATMHGHAVHDAWAGYRKAIADRRRLQKALAYASDALSRAQRLYAGKAISLQERQRAELEQVSAKEQVDMADAEVRRSIEELEHIGIRVDDTNGEIASETTEQIPVRSPMGGTVLDRLVTPGTTVTPGTGMFVVSDLSTLWAVAELDEAQLSKVHVGRPVEVRVAAYPTAMFSGTISFVADRVNPKTRRITVRATVPNTDGLLKPEMYATIALGESDARTITVAPASAIQNVDGTSVVFAAENNGRFRVRRVTTGVDTGQGVEIVDGLKLGDRLVTRGSFVLKSELLNTQTQAEN
jgi:membrane fusion protein, heavy metal efflux system